MNKVHNCDCMNYMKNIDDNYFHLAIVDPPYGIGVVNRNDFGIKRANKSACKTNNYKKSNWDNKIPDKKYFHELLRISKNQIIWGVNYFYNYDFSSGKIYWKKNISMNTSSDGELAYCSIINSIKEFEYTWNGMIQGDMKNKEIRIHPTQKPIELYKWILKNYAKKNDIIFDSHVGSGSSRIACYELEFDFVGTELDLDYYNDQEKRFKLEKARIDNKFYLEEDENLLFKNYKY